MNRTPILLVLIIAITVGCSSKKEAAQLSKSSNTPSSETADQAIGKPMREVFDISGKAISTYKVIGGQRPDPNYKPKPPKEMPQANMEFLVYNRDSSLTKIQQVLRFKTNELGEFKFQIHKGKYAIYPADYDVSSLQIGQPGPTPEMNNNGKTIWKGYTLQVDGPVTEHILHKYITHFAP